MPEPARLLDALEEGLHGVGLRLAGLHQLVQRVPHHVNILYALHTHSTWVG